MEQLVKFLPIASDTPIYLAIDIGIAVLLLFAIRSLSGVFTKISVRQELGEKDNFAFGISIAGRMLSLTIVLSAVVGRHIGMGYEAAAIGMLLFGGMGILLVKIGRFAHDKLVLNRLDKDLMISEKNVSVALVDASSAISAAIITKSIIDWAQGADINAFIAVFSGALVVLAVLLFATRLYEYRYAENNQNNSFQETLCNGQIALAIQHSGNLIGIAIAVSSASRLLAFDPIAYVSNVTGWLIVGLGLAFVLMGLTSLAKRVVLLGVNWKSEVALQHNIGIASIEAVLSIGIALLFTNVFVGV
ncbi:DUF350 domain-containing protein [Agaribacter marinus]|uniref:ATP synthase F0 subunit A n=1 Tax=Agaribacter marinus TaxID=1431249 RepID=A0AA37SYI9_9ALTE|nr:DUF350 domain-containing protein [Agaribacter marinus]GLR70949.1 ATP synthase F0 subunit A [Agaribacter marinus]